ncbi:MAG: hypothetical protein ABUL49_00115 [bacterium]
MKRLALIATVAVAALALAADSYDLKRVEKAGDVKKYAVHMDFEVQGMPGDFSADVTQTIDSVDADSKLAKVKHEMANGTANVGGNSMQQDVPTYFTFVGADNWPTKVEGEAANSNTLRFARALSPAFASAPIEIKDGKAHWTTEVKADSEKGLAGWKQEATYTGKESQGGEDCDKVDFELKETEGDQAIVSKGTAWFRHADGAMVKMTTDVQNMPIQGYVINAKYSVTLQK